MDKLFSATMALYNKGPHVERAIRSIQRTAGNYIAEIIVINDGSTDDGPEIVSRLAREDEHIRLVNQPNSGLATARNRAARLAGCPYLLFLDADDEWLEPFVPTVASLVARFPECGVFATAYTRQWPGQQPVRMRYHAVPRDPEGGVLASYFISNAGGANPLWQCAVCVSREALLRAGGYPEGASHSQDRILWARLACVERIAWHPRVCAIQHMGSVNQSLNAWSSEKIRPYFDELASCLERDDLSSEEKNSIRKMIRHEHVICAAISLQKRRFRHAANEMKWLLSDDTPVSNMFHLAKFMIPVGIKEPIRRALLRAS